MKIIKLCGKGSCCPEVKIYEDKVEIGENDKFCVLTSAEWAILKEKIINQEV